MNQYQELNNYDLRQMYLIHLKLYQTYKTEHNKWVVDRCSQEMQERGYNIEIASKYASFIKANRYGNFKTLNEYLSSKQPTKQA